MDIINSIFELIPNFDTLDGKYFSMPLGHAVILLIFSTFCMVWGKFKFGFLVAYLYIFFWMFSNERFYLVNLFGGDTVGMFIYVFTGMTLAIMAFIGFMQETH